MLDTCCSDTPNTTSPDEPSPVATTSDGLTSDGLTPDGLTPDGLTPDGLTSDGLTPDGLTPDGLTPDGLTTDGLTTDGLTPDGLTTDGLTTDGLSTVKKSPVVTSTVKKSPATSASNPREYTQITILYRGKIYYGMNIKMKFKEPVSSSHRKDSEGNFCFIYSEQNNWWKLNILVPKDTCAYGNLVIESNKQNTILLRTHKFEQATEILNYPCIAQYLMELNRAQNLPDPHFNSCTDGEMWCSINWIRDHADRFVIENTSFDYLQPFSPDVCHRKLYVGVMNKTKYIISPFGEADNKSTPLNEYLNYQLGQLLCPPQNVYLPITFLSVVNQPKYKLGIGSVKEFVQIKNSTVTTYDIAPELCSWISLYDFLIGNIERNWNDHLCVDIQNRYCLLDNDTQMDHLKKLNANFKWSKLDHLSDVTKNVCQNILSGKGCNFLNFSKIKAPVEWKNTVLKQLQLVNNKLF